MTVAGLTFSAGLMFLQFGVLHAFCPLCTLSAVVMVGLFWLRPGRRTMATGEWGFAGEPSPGAFAIFPAAILMVSGLSSGNRHHARSGLTLHRPHRRSPECQGAAGGFLGL